MRTSLGKAERDRVLLRGHDLNTEVLGQTTFAEAVALVLLGERPSPDQARMLDALLVVLIEHGFVKPVVVARFVYSNAPESLQAAVAAALLGAGSRHLGSSEWCARMLQEALRGVDESDALDMIAEGIVEEHLRSHERIPGVGHATHTIGDPRATRLYEIARETGTFGRHCQLLAHVSRIAEARLGRALPVNVTGAVASIASDMGFRWEITRAFALIGRTLGAIGHIQEEIAEPVSDELVRGIAATVTYDPDARLGISNPNSAAGVDARHGAHE